MARLYGVLKMNTPDIFNTPVDEAKRHAEELSAVRATLKEVSAHLGRLENRARKVFAASFPPKKAKANLNAPRIGVTLTPGEAMTLFDSLAEQCRQGQRDSARHKLES